MTTAERRAAILQQLAHAGAPLAARTLATYYGVSRQVIVQDLAVIRASHPGIISTARGYVLDQPDQPAGCTREFKVRHTPDRAGAEPDCGLWRPGQKYQHQPPGLWPHHRRDGHPFPAGRAGISAIV